MVNYITALRKDGWPLLALGPEAELPLTLSSVPWQSTRAADWKMKIVQWLCALSSVCTWGTSASLT